MMGSVAPSQRTDIIATASNSAAASANSSPTLKLWPWGCNTSITPTKPIAAPIQVAFDTCWRETAQAMSGIQSGALYVSRVALLSGINVIATNSAYQQAVPVAARRTCRPIFSVRSDAHPPRHATGRMNSRQSRFWNSNRTPVEVYWPDTFASAPTIATQKKAAVVRSAPRARFSALRPVPLLKVSVSRVR